MTIGTTEDEARLRIDLAYDGTEFSGWARQPGLRTVQGELEAAIAMLLRLPEDEVRLTVAGRTDAGVHARGQVAHLDVAGVPLARWDGRAWSGEDAAGLARLRARRLNGVLKRSLGLRGDGRAGRSPDIAIHSVREVTRDFDARFSALSRRYEYRIRDDAARRDPLSARFTVELPHRLDLDAMRRASDELLGLNDFTTFCKAREGATAVRDLKRFEWSVADDGAYVALIEADAFCHSMVRALIGAVVGVGSGRIDERELIGLREARERTSRFTVMPAHGLSLEEIGYPADEELAARAEQTRARRDPLS